MYKQLRTSLLMLCVSGMLTPTSALSYMDDTVTGASDTVELSMVHFEHTRQKRSITQLPDILHFRFDMNGFMIQLNMTQSKREIAAIPLYTSDERGTILQENVPMDEDVSIFQDAPQGTVVIVKRLGGDDYHVAGNFHHGNKMYKIWPETHHVNRRSADVSNSHIVRQVKHYDLHHDARVVSTRDHNGRNKRSAENVNTVRYSDNTLLRRHRRQTTSYTIELGVFSDFSDYSFFLNEAGGNSVTAMANARMYYGFLEESIQLRYNTVNAQDSSVDITVWIKYINMATTAALSPWTENIKIGSQLPDLASLNSFTDYIEAGTGFINADHYMTFTRLDMEANGNTNIAGIAFVASICTTSSTSIVENTFDGFTGALAAHELGHSLNALHDSDEGCNDVDNFVMTPGLDFPSLPNPSNLWTFSSCSVAVFKSFLAGKACATSTTIAGGISDGSQVAGQALNADAQCARTVGTGSKYCRTAYTNNQERLCQVLPCSGTDGNIDDCQGSIAHEGTSCGDGKWCVKGVCVAGAAAPSTPANCPQGDDPTFGCQLSSCASYTANQLILCCSTCSQADSETMPPIEMDSTTDLPETDSTTSIFSSTPTDTIIDSTTASDITDTSSTDLSSSTLSTTTMESTTPVVSDASTDGPLEGTDSTSVSSSTPSSITIESTTVTDTSSTDPSSSTPRTTTMESTTPVVSDASTDGPLEGTDSTSVSSSTPSSITIESTTVTDTSSTDPSSSTLRTTTMESTTAVVSDASTDGPLEGTDSTSVSSSTPSSITIESTTVTDTSSTDPSSSTLRTTTMESTTAVVSDASTDGPLEGTDSTSVSSSTPSSITIESTTVTDTSSTDPSSSTLRTTTMESTTPVLSNASSDGPLEGDEGDTMMDESPDSPIPTPTVERFIVILC